ncbi:MAG: Na+/H+ antiporter NhaC family protein [Thermoguttaceae bacterium]
MPGAVRRWIARLAPVAGCGGVCLAALVGARHLPANGPPWYGIVPPLLAVGLALLTNRLFLSLGAAVAAGGFLAAWGKRDRVLPLGIEGLREAGRFVRLALWPADDDPAHLEILLFVVFIMAMVCVMLVGGGLHALANWLARYARSRRSTQLVAALLGIAVFFDDYSNTMIVGPTMRPVSDRHRISREKLAFIVDATAAPIAGIAVISTWIGFEVGLLTDAATRLGLAQDGYALFFDAVGFRFYCLGMIAFMLCNGVSGEDFGPMAKAERRARQLGKPLDDNARPLTSRALSTVEPHAQARSRVAVGLLPLVGLLAVFLVGLWLDGGGWEALGSDPLALLRLSAWRRVLSQARNTRVLVWASAFGLVAAAGLARTVGRLPGSAIGRAMALGARSSLLPAAILVLAWSLGETCRRLGTGDFLARMLVGTLWPSAFPPLVFLVACLISFATGTSWGTMAILIPTALPVAFQLDGAAYGLVTVLSIAAVLDGAIFGDHCSPISDTTILSSAAAACDHLAHVRTQLPYSLLVAGLALMLGYVPAGLGAPCWAGILGGAAVSAAILFGLKALRRPSR